MERCDAVSLHSNELVMDEESQFSAIAVQPEHLHGRCRKGHSSQ